MFQALIIALALASSLADGPLSGAVQQLPEDLSKPVVQANPVAAPTNAAITEAIRESVAETRVPVPKIVLATAEEKDAYNAKYQKLARESFKTSKPDSGLVVPQLVNMFNELRTVEGFQKSELARMRDTLRVRMLALSDQLHRDIAKSKQLVESPTARLHARIAAASTYKRRDSIDSLLDDSPAAEAKTESRVARSESDTKSDVDAERKTPEALAATEQQNAQSLIDLIQNTIDPDSWESHGGGGSIYYYAPLHALVIRQTEEVHRQIGGVLGGLNK